MAIDPTIRIDIWHNILWSKYKGEVFSSLHQLAKADGTDIHFFQMAETEGNRLGLAGVDLSHHRYPYELIFKGSLDNTSLWQRVTAMLKRTLISNANLFIMTGYEKPECWLQLLLIKLKGKKAAVFCDSTIFDQKQRYWRGLLKRIFFKSVDGIFGYGERSRDYVLHYGANPAGVFHRCQAAALSTHYTPEKAAALRQENRSSIPRYLYVGRLSPEKNIDVLINAFAAVRQSQPQAQLIIVGGGPSHDNLKKQAQILKIADSISFTGGKSGDDLFMEYAKATTFILPSRSEPWGLVINESLSYGCPVIVSDRCGCVPELVVPGKTGFVFKTGFADELAQRMLSALDIFADTAATTQACLSLMTNFTPDKAAEQILTGCKTILSSRS